ncbi:alpha/beta hydrolase [Gordonia desulfuricans]|uniref:Alpha/beta hydrolase n=1 Tax=Gordonia desulfuricans TaxID=89051 RepID=A0A7K3LM16_9ACTN|nr:MULTISPECIES: alpha/beta hydrolase [Gordonia]NDK89289.1 alpha/beta hydrolase [Gordonia desulfuricans]WLP91799.1 alpha/beta hydrolase [Gordonia sp. NB41Y]
MICDDSDITLEPTPSSTPSPVLDDATPVVLIHGLRVSGTSMRRIAAAIDGRAVRTPDLPGHGQRFAEKFSLDDAVQTVLDTADEFGRPVVLAGISLGGYVTMAAAGRHPDRIAGLVVMGSTAQPSRMLAAPFRLFGFLTGMLPGGSAVISKILTRLAVGRQVAEDMEAGGLALHSIADVVDEVARFDALAELSRYRGPTLLANGAWDQFRMHEQRFAALSQDTEVRVIPRATHLYPLIQPEVTGAMIGDFAARLDQVRSSDAG